MKPESDSLDDRNISCSPLVLVVDDDPVHHKLFELLGNRLGVTVQLVFSCAEAIDALKMFSFDMILMDCRMPEVDGCMCTQQIRSLHEVRGRIPIIAVTADVMPGNREKCLKAGMDDFLAKPFTLDELNQKLSFWSQKNEKPLQ